MKIAIAELRAVINRLLDHAEGLGHSELEVTADFYWDLNPAEAFDISRDPTDITVGQLTHDWERLSVILNDEHEPISYGLVWAAALLRWIGNHIVH